MPFIPFVSFVFYVCYFIRIPFQFYLFTGIGNLEASSVSGNTALQGLSQLVVEKLVPYLQQEGTLTLVSTGISIPLHILVSIQ